jgi:nitrogen-specific signal transduction histidine kinase/CheY-like chemotaxis protein
MAGYTILPIKTQVRQNATHVHKYGASMESDRRLETIGILSSGIAHDFNNLLVTIIGNADLTLKRLPPDDPTRQYVTNIKTASMRASDLVGQLLVYSGSGTMIRTPVEMHRIAEETVALLIIAIPPQVTLDIRYGDRSPIVLVNETQLRRIVMNLITNAADAIGYREGIIRITTGISKEIPGSDIELQPNDKHEWGFLEVADNGPGISPEIREHLFDPFYTTKPSGKGLGLAIVHEHVRENGGIITIGESSDGGARFTVFFPITDKREEQCTTKQVRKEAIAVSGGVLVIDDERDVLETTAGMLEDAGCTVYTASSGTEGIKCFKKKRNCIGLVIIDLTMPGKDGFALAREIREIHATVPIVLSSGYNQSVISNDSPVVSVNAYLQKPYQMDYLLATVAEWMSKT